MKKYVFAILLAFSTSAFAYTDCQYKEISSIYIGDGNLLYISYIGGGGVNIFSSSNPQYKEALALATTALMGGKKITVRVQSDNANCGVVQNDFRGMYLAP